MKHLSTRRRRKQIVISLVAASESEWWLNRMCVILGRGCMCGVVGSDCMTTTMVVLALVC